MWFALFIFVGGVCFTVFGGRILFEDGYVEKLQNSAWKSLNERMAGKEGYMYDKYARGVRYFVSGLILTGEPPLGGPVKLLVHHRPLV